MKTMMPAIAIFDACFEDAEAILALQKLAYQSEAKIYNRLFATALDGNHRRFPRRTIRFAHSQGNFG